MTVKGIKMKYLGVIVISLFFLTGCNNQNSQNSQENDNLGASNQPLKKISNIIYTDYIDGASTRVAMVTNGFEVPCEGQTNKECGGACGRKTYADADNNNFICCPSGETDTYGARDYCTEMPKGSTCASDAMCANGACGRKTYADSDNNNFICCPSGETDNYLTRDYCTEMPKGSICATDTMCANGACGRKEAGDDNLICCSSGATDTYGGLDYCTEMKDGSKCWSNAMCAGGDCNGVIIGFNKGTCQSKHADGASCSHDDQCKNNACGRKTYADSDNNNYICCPSGETDTYGGRDYCTEMPKGSTCASDAMCANDACGRDNNDHLICCPSGHTHLNWELEDYCGK